TLFQDDGKFSARPFPDDQEQWILLDGTPASCAQIGLFHFFQERGPIDLVVSGPNYGRNSTALFSLGSGTLGGAMEATLCGKRAIALSYAFESRVHDPEVIGKASNLSARLIAHLLQEWPSDVDLFSVNVPLRKELLDDDPKIQYTSMLANRWSSGSSFEEVSGEDEDPAEQEREIREGGETTKGDIGISDSTKQAHKHFKWAPKFADVHKSVRESGPGNDGWAIMEGMEPDKFVASSEGYKEFSNLDISVQENDRQQERLSPSIPIHLAGPRGRNAIQVYALVNYPDTLAQPYLLEAFSNTIPSNQLNIIPSLSALSSLRSPHSRTLQITSYESIDFNDALSNPTTSFINAYIIRKALIRKHYLSATIASWSSKHPDSILKFHFKPTVDFELDYAEFLDDALIEAFELHEAFERNQHRESGEVIDGTLNKEWWILKPGMSDGGNGIRLFSTYEELQLIFEEWEEADGDSTPSITSNDDRGQDTPAPNDNNDPQNSRIITSHLRHFTAQPYIDAPLLLPSAPYNSRKFHIRTYVLALGALTLYHYTDMLALFSSVPYTPPPSSFNASPSPSPNSHPNTNLPAHLTNTCFQSPSSSKLSSIHLFSSLPLPPSALYTHATITRTIRATLSTLFLHAAPSQRTNFQPLPNAYEIFGVDFLVDAEGKPWLLEVNAFPDFGQTGEVLGGRVVGCLMGEVGRVVGGWVLGNQEEKREGYSQEGEGGDEGRGRLVEIGRVDLGLSTA
ncbi:MAG: hypothetical protein Q9160_009201, partial [Pyrenula sp. 1 TL-2023]